MEPESSEPRTASRPAAGNGDRRQAPRQKYDLEERLLEFALAVVNVSEQMPASRAAAHIANQLLRSGTSPYGNHGEAQSPESAEDFIHKMKICLKELRETRRWARLIDRKRWLAKSNDLGFVLTESEELIRIFNASIRTAERNRISGKRLQSAKPPEDIPNH